MQKEANEKLQKQAADKKLRESLERAERFKGKDE